MAAQYKSGLSERSGNVDGVERWFSMIAGTGLALSMLRGGGTLRRLIGGAAALSLLARGATGYCGMKAAMQGETSLKDGIKEQFDRVSSQLSGRTVREITSMQALYGAELQELYSAESQLAALIDSLCPTISNQALSRRLSDYASELRSRQTELDSLLANYQLDPNEHADDAMKALIKETKKMKEMYAASLRDAALTASVQRITHYKIASYGTIAAYAKALGKLDEAARFAHFADRDKAVDAELTELAKKTLNPEATTAPDAGVSAQEARASLRPH